MRRVVVTGLGVVSSIGNNAQEVLQSLRTGASGIIANDHMREHGFRSQIAGSIKLDPSEHIDKRTLRFMGQGAAFAYIAMEQAIADAGLSENDVSNQNTGLIAGSGGPSTSAMLQAHQTVLNSGAPKRIGPFAVPKCMSSTVSANLSTAFKIKGINYSITSACSTSLHCIGNAAEQIMLGKQELQCFPPILQLPEPRNIGSGRYPTDRPYPLIYFSGVAKSYTAYKLSHPVDSRSK